MAIGEYLGAGSSVTKGLYHLNGNANDSSGNAINGTATNVTWTDGIIGNGSASFNGINSKIESVYHLNSSADFTFNVYITIQSLSSTQIIYWKQGNPEPYTYFLIDLSGKVNFFINPTALVSNTVLSTNQKYLLTFTRIGTTSSIYINGTLDKSNSWSLVNQFNPTAQAFGENENLNWYKGNIDEAFFENYGWTATQIKQYYTYSKGRFATI